MRTEHPYTFNIVNSVKARSMFQNGMQPVLFSVAEAKAGRVGWVRAAYDICYYRNQYMDEVGGPPPAVATASKVKTPLKGTRSTTPNRSGATAASNFGDSRPFYTTSMTIVFRHDYDVCYLAYHYPYSYSYLLVRAFDTPLNWRTESFVAMVVAALGRTVLPSRLTRSVVGG